MKSPLLVQKHDEKRRGRKTATFEQYIIFNLPKWMFEDKKVAG